MKYLLCSTLLLLLFSKATNAQDTIVKTDGTKIIAQVQEVGTTEIKYKKYATAQTSPVYDIAKSDVNMIKYHDGTQDVFPPTPAPAPAPVPTPTSVTYVQPLYTLYAQPDTNSSISAAYIYLGGLASPLNSFDPSMINNYWQNMFANETGGYIKTTKGNPMLYSFYMGGTLQFHKRSNWSYEFQFEYTPQPIMDSANFPDGTHGSLKLSYMLLNDAIQYTRNIDTAGRLQIGGEASLDIGITFGSESDVFANTGTNPSNVNQDFDDMHLGSHFALVGKYFINKAKTIGLEGRLGYRFMNIPATSFDYMSNNGYSGPLNLDGPFASLGIVFRFRSSYSVQVNDSYYYGY